jgi:long-chain acyl-CoA synthetase
MQILADAEPIALVVGPGAGRFVWTPGSVESLRRVVAVADGGYDAWVREQSAQDPGVRTGPEETAVILYTSGTTGSPKGVMLSGANFGRALATIHSDTELTDASVAMAPIPFFHVAGLGLALAANLNGATLLLDSAGDPAELVSLLQRHRVSHAVLVPALIQSLVNLPDVLAADWSALKYVIYGAAAIPLPVVQRATAVFGCKFLQSYGLTESTGGVTTLWPEDHLPEPGREHRLQSVGLPMPGVSVRLVDPVTLVDVPVGQRGEVLIGGRHVTKGYWRRPLETAKAYLPGGWLRTGDGGSFDEDGYLYLHDRLKDMIISGGENVYPAEVESVLTGHPQVAEVAVVGLASDRWGESPLAVVVPRPGTEPDAADIIAWSRERLAHFKCPVAVEFVEALPRNASGKLLKTRIREQFSIP